MMNLNGSSLGLNGWSQVLSREDARRARGLGLGPERAEGASIRESTATVAVRDPKLRSD